MKSIFCLLFAICFGFFSYSQITPYAFVDQISKKPDTLNFQEYSKALIKLESTFDSTYSMFYVLRAELKLAAGMTELAKADLRKAINIDPQNAYSHYKSGIIYRNEMKLDSAIYEFELAIQKDPEYNQAKIELGIIYCGLKEAKKSNDILKPFFDVSPVESGLRARLYCAIGYNFETLKDYNNAIKYMTKCAELNPLVATDYQIGRLYYKVKNYRMSNKYLERVYAQDSTYEDVTVLLAANYFLDENFEKSLPYFKKFFNSNAHKDIPEFLLLYGSALLRAKEYEEALIYFDRYLLVEPSSPYVYYDKGIALYRLKQKKDACDCWLKANELNLSSASTMYRQNCEGKNPKNEKIIDKIDRRVKTVVWSSEKAVMYVFNKKSLEIGENIIYIELKDRDIQSFGYSITNAAITRYISDFELILKVAKAAKSIKMNIVGHHKNGESIDLFKGEIQIH